MVSVLKYDLVEQKPSIDDIKIKEYECVLIKPYLWTVKSAFQVFLCYILLIFLQPVTNLNTNPGEWAKQKQVVGQTWSVGHSLLTSALVDLLSWLLHDKIKCR